MRVRSLFITLTLLSSFSLPSLLAEDLYLIVGQSNAAGRGALPSSPEALVGVEVLDEGDSFTPAFPNLNVFSTVRNLNQEAGFNLGYTFAERIRETVGEDVQLVVNARGGTSIVHWAPEVVDDAAPLSYFDEAIRRVNAALAANPDATLRGILWHQGESNRNRSAYMSELVSLIGEFRTRLGNVPFVAGQLSHEREDNATFNANLLQLPSLVANTAVVTAEGLTTDDGTHFTAPALQTLGERYADEMLSLLGVEPPTEPGGERILLFADSFDRSDSANLNASDAGQSGSLSPLNYVSRSFNVAGPEIRNNSLLMVGTASSVIRDGSFVYLDHNFTDPAIVDGGGFSVSVDIADYATTGSSRQMSIGVGQSLAELTALGNVRATDGVSDLFVSYRGTTNTLEIYKGGTLDDDETVVGGLPADPVTMRVEYSLSGFTAGSLVSYEVFFGAETAAFSSGTFVWSGTNENYLMLSSNLNEDSRFDHLEVRGRARAADYSTWSDGFSGVDLTDPEGDLDGDGSTNNEERLWGLDPTDASSVSPFTTVLGVDGTFSYTRRDPSLTGYTYRVFSSMDLETWTEDVGAVVVPSAPNVNLVETVSVTLSSGELGEDRLFVRVGAEAQ